MLPASALSRTTGDMGMVQLAVIAISRRKRSGEGVDQLGAEQLHGYLRSAEIVREVTVAMPPCPSSPLEHVRSWSAAEDCWKVWQVPAQRWGALNERA